MPDQPTAQPVVYRLEDLDVQEVSVVDRGANKSTKLNNKRDEEKAEKKTTNMKEQQNNTETSKSLETSRKNGLLDGVFFSDAK